jgi:alanyl-tRNA synthetase
VEASVDAQRRRAIQRNHTATHLLHAALRRVVGDHVHQKGSLVEPYRLRFDATHYAAFKPEELLEAENIVREKILENLSVETFETDHTEAVKQGAMALFGEKYGDRVRVVRIGDFSMELCGGTHVTRTGDIGPFQLVGEGSVSAGVRRLEAVTAEGADGLYRKQKEVLDELSLLLKAPQGGLVERVRRLVEENRELKSRRPAASSGELAVTGDLLREPIGGVLFVSATLPEAAGKDLRLAYDGLKKEAEKLVVALFGTRKGAVQILVALSRSLAKAGWDAREALQAGSGALGARGGGRPEMAQAGGSGDAAAIRKACGDIRAWVRAKAGA